MAASDKEWSTLVQSTVEMINYRLHLNRLNGQAKVGSILDAPSLSSSFDYIVALGCYHHTGNLQRAINESYRLLRRNGRLIFMVYNGLSYRHWCSDWKATLRHALTWRSEVVPHAMSVKYDYSKGQAAPYTLGTEGDRLSEIAPLSANESETGLTGPRLPDCHR